MSVDQPRNLAASVRQRLYNIAKRNGEAFDLVLTRYALERLLYRLGQSECHNQFLLKGAMLFAVWDGESHRPTRDVDLLGFGSGELSHLEKTFRDICLIPVEPDGLEFIADNLRAIEIRENQEYQGVRVLFDARLENAIIPIQIDIGYGDAVTPAAEDITYPTVLDFAPPKLRAYPIYTVVAEKFQAMVWLGIANSRMKDFYDIWIILRKYPFDGNILVKAITATFERRNTPLPAAAPFALTQAFASDKMKQMQWKAFLQKNKLSADNLTFADIIMALHEFLIPPMLASINELNFDVIWRAGGPWQIKSLQN
ncbi:MAG: nucleotidyl transferase AbiEii/AbiGii toxin family protein [Sulfuriferula sp.]